MPFSQSSQLSSIVGFLETSQPKSILDVGTGFGQYGFLARTNIEHFNLFEVNGAIARKRERSEWNIVIDGIEAFKDYITPVHEYAYNNIFIGNAMDVLPTLTQRYDIVLAIDILEHFDKDEGRQFIELLKHVCSGSVLVSTPKEFIEQHIEANPYEDHRSCWSLADLQACGFTAVLENHESWIMHLQMPAQSS
ncbi:MAG: class I SAM-dependent methyltransferase [Pseudohongiella sp.]|nr:class I SAM-dependent methyltransferase [Pseudohongiella sp.]MDP1757186.1 class I SAM-dependent methyltransferase [Pseudohongiella sp.]MDP2091671.1 class I SAM-dependent methyltransferase [Pseudohongiella sp.]